MIDPSSHDPHRLPANLPVPPDDGRARHLWGAGVPDLVLSSTGGERIHLREITQAPTVLFFYPRTGVPGQPPSRGFQGEDWDEIPGARGCTPQNCAFRDRYTELRQLGVQTFGVSTQTTEFQTAFKTRNHVPFDYLSDSDLQLTRALSLPSFEFPVESGGPNTLIRRMAWFVTQGRIEKVWYPVFPPDENAAQVLAWLELQLPLFVGREHEGIVYQRTRELDPRELAQVFASSGISRPDRDPARLATMIAHANLIVTARAGGQLVGVARALSDFSWCTYLSDLAVHAQHQRRGIGQRLIELVRAAGGPECALVLAAAKGAEDYYPRIGMERLPAAFRFPRVR